MIRALFLLTTVIACGLAHAQTPPAVQDQSPEAPKGRKVERIRTEDSRVAIDEIRVGGETQSIQVQPKNGMPAYEVAPADLGRPQSSGSRDATGTPGGRSLWNVFKF